MVDFNKRVINSDKFRQAAIFFQEHGCYTLAPRGTTDYNSYWDREAERCINGYVAPDGDAITGYHYFYLNYSPIMKLQEVEYTDRYGAKRTRRERIFGFPRFWDYDYYYFNAIEEAEEQGKHMATLKCRQRGYSFKGASMLVRNYELIPGSKNFAVASEQKFLIGDGILTKAWQIMDFVDKHTDWSKQRLTSTRMERVAGFKVTDEFGKQTEQGYLSSITGITLKNDPERLRGTRGKLVLFEEGGKFPNLETAWRVEQPAVETDDGVAFGLLCLFGTGGTEGGSFDGLKNIFYNPDAFNVLGFENIWDDGQSDKKCGFFVPAWSNMEGSDENGNPIYMDRDGNSLKEKAVEELIKQRNIIKDGGASQTSIDRFISERPLKPQEAVLELGKNIFPRKLLMNQLTRIRTNEKLRNMKHIVDLRFENGNVVATEKKSGDITTYHLKKDDKPHGSIVIWEYPVKDPPYGLYVGGCLTPGEKVCTQRGLVNVEDVTLDDKLINKDGKFVNIRNLQRYEKEDENIYTIKTANTYRTTTFTGEHPILCAKSINDKYDFVKAKDIQVGNYCKFPNIYYDTNRFCKEAPINSDLFWWFVGLWLGDGWCDVKKRSVSIAFDVNQKFYFQKCYNFIQNELGIVPYYRTRKNTIELNFTSKTIQQWLHATFGNSCYNKSIPDYIKRINDRYKLNIIAGYLASDGCVYNHNNTSIVEFVSVNLTLLEDIQDLLFALKVIGGITKLRNSKQAIIQGRIVNQQEAYHIRIAQSGSILLKHMFDAHNIQDTIKASKIIDRQLSNHSNKQMVFDDEFKSIVCKIKEITTNKYTGTVYNFECDTHTFMCRNIMTHNCDPYDHDESFTNSLGSTFIFKRVQAGEAWNDVIVAEYSGRPDTAEEYYENVRKLLLFYNARLLFENERKGIYPYFTNKHCDYLLADQPDKVISEIFKDSKVQRRKGCHMTKSIRAYGEGLILEWLMDEYEPGRLNLERIYSEPLLEELIENDGIRNVDRVIALCMVMIYREELYQIKTQAHKDKNKQVELFETPLFGNNYWDNDVPEQDDIPTFTL